MTSGVPQAWQSGHEANNLLQQRTDKKILKNTLDMNRFLGHMTFMKTLMHFRV
jgi:hypothetical protein